VFTWFKSRAQDRRTAVDLYGAVVTQARQPAFFGAEGVSDTPEGRIAMIVAVMFPVLERLAAEGSRMDRVARYLTETFITDVDDTLREMGVGDMAVPKKVKRAAQSLGECCLAYRRAVQTADPATALSAEFATSVPGLEANPKGADALARRILKLNDHLGAVPLDRLTAGIAEFADTAEAGSPRAAKNSGRPA
jgi:cytochrome b pre-mRNA-processing protein 3